jgi:hypothetical protein
MNKIIFTGGCIKNEDNIYIDNISIIKQDTYTWETGTILINNKFITNIYPDESYNICIDDNRTLTINNAIYYQSSKLFKFTVILNSSIYRNKNDFIENNIIKYISKNIKCYKINYSCSN